MGMCHRPLKFTTLFWSGKTQTICPVLKLRMLIMCPVLELPILPYCIVLHCIVLYCVVLYWIGFDWILFLVKTLKNQGLFWRKSSKFGFCSRFLEVKNRPWLVAHTRIPDISKFPQGFRARKIQAMFKIV